MNQSADEEEHAGSSMNTQGHPDPTKPCAHLKQDENHVQHPQEQNDRDSSYLHRSPFYSLTVTFTVPGPLLPWLLQLA